jgi:hypothetical protein
MYMQNMHNIDLSVFCILKAGLHVREMVSSTEDFDRTIKTNKPVHQSTFKTIKPVDQSIFAILRLANSVPSQGRRAWNPAKQWILDSSDEYTSYSDGEFQVKIKGGESWNKFRMIRRRKLILKSSTVSQTIIGNKIFGIARDDSIVDFGKHRGKTFSFVRLHHRAYCDWILSNQAAAGSGMEILQAYLHLCRDVDAKEL